MKKILRRNRVKCLNCGEILESKFRHDFQQCSCDNETFCDGGLVYQRIGGININKVEIINDEDDKTN